MIPQPFGIVCMQKTDFPFYVTLLTKKILSTFICGIETGYRFNVSQIKIIFLYRIYFLKHTHFPSTIIHVGMKIAERVLFF